MNVAPPPPRHRAHPARLLARVRGMRLAAEASSVERWCLFVGHPRSGHSLVGSLLDAHREAVVAHELDCLRYLAAGYGRLELVGLVLDRDRRFNDAGRQWFDYDYTVPGQWQGRWSRLRVVGDKKGGITTERLADDPTLLATLRDVVGVPVRLVHAVRNPFDNVATMARRSGQSLEEAAVRYLRLCEQLVAVHALARDDVLVVAHEAMVADPRKELRGLCSFLGLDADEGWLEACASVVFDRPRRTRDGAPWTTELVRMLHREIERYPFLRAQEYTR